MITGDHRLTAVAIAKELGIYRDGDLAVTAVATKMVKSSPMLQERR